MKLHKLLRPTNRRARVLVGLLLATLFCIQCTSTEANRRSKFVRAIDGEVLGRNAPEVLARVKELAQSDHIALLEYCLAGYGGRYGDYTCTFIKREKIGGKLGKEQWIDVKFMESPFSVAMKWSKNPPMGDRILYIEGKRNDQMLVRPTNAFLRSLVGGSVLRAPDGPEARKSTLRPVSMFGFKRSTQSLLKVYRKAKEAGDLKEAYGGLKNVAGRDAVVLVRFLPAKKDYPAHKTLVYIDLEYLVPVRVEAYGWDGKPACEYTYKDIKFNVGLDAEDFLPKNNDLVAPR